MNKIKKSKNYITIKISLQWISTNYNYNTNTAKMGQASCFHHFILVYFRKQYSYLVYYDIP